MPSPADQPTGSVDAAVDALVAGQLVAFPTETVYGLGADASNEDAVRAIFAAKGRPADHPLIVHLASPDQLARWSSSPRPPALALAEAFWPGPLSIIVPRARHVLDVVTGGRSSVGLRVPAHAVAHTMLAAFAERSRHGGVAAPSANRFGRVSPTMASHVRTDLGDRVEVVLDGGEAAVGLESTIVDCTVDPPMVLRHGAVTVEMLEVVVELQPATGPSRAPGMMASHYAPRCRVVPVESSAEAEAVLASERSHGRAADILHGLDDLPALAHRLYREFRHADDRSLDALIVVLPLEVGLGRAIRDRVIKAAADNQTRGSL
jgi:L-threonylcarbamoyladenylate synthase